MRAAALRREQHDVVPTGEITVRFRETPDEQQLQRFASGHKLRLLRQNEFVPQQAVFQPAGMTRTTGYASRMYGDADSAIPSEREGEGFRPTVQRKTDRTMHAAGGLGTTALARTVPLFWLMPLSVKSSRPLCA